MTDLQKFCKKKVMSFTIPFTIPIIEKEEEFYVEIYHLDKDTIETNDILLHTPKQELAEILKLKSEVFYLKVTI